MKFTPHVYGTVFVLSSTIFLLKYTTNRITQLGSQELQKKVRRTHNAMLGSKVQPQFQSPSSALTHKTPGAKIMPSH